jgi:regulator of protease activity HflC (stomatin/prohibitin superfamily)
MAVSSKRAEYIALLSLVLSVVFFGIAFFIGRWSGFFAVSAVGWLMLSAALIWLVLTIQFHQRVLAEQEKLDTAQLAKAERGPRIFQAEGERATLFAAAQRRLEILEKWFIPIFAGLIATYQTAIGLYLLTSIQAESEVQLKQPLLCAVFMTGIAFVSFLLSRYATGMSAQLQWKPLRAGGSCLLGIAVLCFALAIGLALAPLDFRLCLSAVGWVIPILLVVLGVETALNVVLDIYRPRLKDQYSRAAFDSRLLGLINEPGEIFRTAASAIDYQFGFQVSQTWFYKLLEKAIVPLVLFAAITLYLLSCLVVVAPDEEAIVEHFGDPRLRGGQSAPAEGAVRHIGPGLSFKWPWPIDVVHKRATKRISEISVGFVPKPEQRGEKGGYGPLLWGKTHYEKEYELLVASEQRGIASAEGAVPVSLVMAAVPVQYRIKDLYSFIYNHNEPEKLLESICYRELTKFAASAKIEVDSEADLEHSLLGAGRGEAKKALTENIQAAADSAGLGIEIVFLGLQGLHPPPDVAADYQKVVGAVQQKQALILNAHAERNRSLGTLAGSVKDAEQLYDLAAKYQKAEQRGDSEQLEKLGNDLDSAFAQAKGDIFSRLAEAQSYAFEKAILAKATGERFASQVKAYRAAKEIYKREPRLMALEKALPKIRKFVVVADPNDEQVFIIDLQEKQTPSVYDLAGLPGSSEK